MLVRAMRYGDVRSTDTTALGEVATSLLVRIEAALPTAVTGLGDEAAETLAGPRRGGSRRDGAAVGASAGPSGSTPWSG